MGSAPQLRPLTVREQRAADFFRRAWVAEVVLAIGAVTEGTLGRGLVQAYCKSAPSGPLGGSLGAAYCANMRPPYTWAAFIAVAVAGALVAGWLCRRLTYRRTIALVVVFVAVIANTIVVWSLPDGAGP
jgi:hypothetical protein